MAYPSNQLRIREGKVTPITIPEDQLNELKKFLNSDKYTSWRKDAMIKQVMDGTCCVCREVPSMQVTYRYCSLYSRVLGH